jgi:hypothetical protein
VIQKVFLTDPLTSPDGHNIFKMMLFANLRATVASAYSVPKSIWIAFLNESNDSFFGSESNLCFWFYSMARMKFAGTNVKWPSKKHQSFKNCLATKPGRSPLNKLGVL